MNLLFTICGRAGSKGVKNKNIKKMSGIPLVYYALALIKKYGEIHDDINIDIAINTDSDELISIVKKQNILKNIFFVNRKKELADDLSKKVDVIQDTYLIMKKNKNYDFIIDLDITSPYRRIIDLENAINSMILNPDYDLVYSVVKARRNPYYNMVEKKEDGSYRRVCKSNYDTRQQAPDIYELNASIYVYKNTMLDNNISKSIIEYNCGIIEMRDYLVLDIDSEEDFEMMNFLHPYYCKDDKMLNEIFEIAKLFCK